MLGTVDCKSAMYRRLLCLLSGILPVAENLVDIYEKPFIFYYILHYILQIDLVSALFIENIKT